jgi:hypothetical protein
VETIGLRHFPERRLLRGAVSEQRESAALSCVLRDKIAFNLSLTRHFQTLDRISRYFKAKFSALIR